MKSVIIITISILIIMIGCPWFAVTFAGTAGMAICFILFFAINPLFSIVCGVFAGKNIKKLWMLPIFNAGAFLLGTWLFFEMGEPAFWLYCVVYLMIGICAMLVTSAFYRRKVNEYRAGIVKL